MSPEPVLIQAVPLCEHCGKALDGEGWCLGCFEGRCDRARGQRMRQLLGFDKTLPSVHRKLRTDFDQEFAEEKAACERVWKRQRAWIERHGEAGKAVVDGQFRDVKAEKAMARALRFRK